VDAVRSRFRNPQQLRTLQRFRNLHRWLCAV